MNPINANMCWELEKQVRLSSSLSQKWGRTERKTPPALVPNSSESKFHFKIYSNIQGIKEINVFHLCFVEMEENKETATHTLTAGLNTTKQSRLTSSNVTCIYISLFILQKECHRRITTPSPQNMSFLSLSTSLYPFFPSAPLLSWWNIVYTCIYALLRSSPVIHPRVKSMNGCCWCCCYLALLNI